MRLALSPTVVSQLQKKLGEKLDEPVGFDTEFSGPRFVDSSARKPRLNAYRSTLTGYSFAFLDGSSFYVPVSHQDGGNVSKRASTLLLLALVKRTGYIFCHNVKAELQQLQNVGFTLRQLYAVKFRCTQVLMWLLEKPAPGKSPYGLKALALHHFGHEMTKFEELTKGANIDTLSSEDPALLEYGCEDAIFALRLGVEFSKQLEPTLESVYHNVESKFVYVLRYMEGCGFAIDADNLTALAAELTAKLKVIDDELAFVMPGVNIRSDKQLREWGFAGGRWPLLEDFPLTEKTQEHSLTAEGLQLLLEATEEGTEGWLVSKLLLERAEFDKMLSTYTHTLVARAAEYPDGRLHSDYQHTLTSTGRLSSSKPNLQNISTRSELGKRIRTAFVATPGNTLVSADYSQIELRVLGHLAGGKGKLAEAYQECRDVHQQTADLVGCSRTQAKTVNFLIVFGGGARGLAKQLKCTVPTAQGYIDNYLKAYPEIAGLRDSTVRVATNRGYIKTLLGRRKNIPQLHSQDRKEVAYGKRIALNIPCQGGARDIMILAMIALLERILESGNENVVRFATCVHDDMVLECPVDKAEEWAKLLSSCMENAFPLRLPLVAEAKIAPSWDLHK